MLYRTKNCEYFSLNQSGMSQNRPDPYWFTLGQTLVAVRAADFSSALI